MAVLRLDHVQLAMPAGREAEAVSFYEGVLGLPQVPKPDSLADTGGCWFELDDVKVHLGVDPDFTPASKAHPALVVDDVAALAAAARVGGYPVKEDDRLPGVERVFVNDPFGNRIELMRPR